MKIVRAFVIGATAVGLAASPALAQQQQDQQQRQAQDQQQGQRQAALIAADTLRGAEVRDRQGQNIGSIDEIHVNPQSGKIERVLINPGLGRDSFQASWDNVDVKRDGQQIVLTMDRPAAGADPAASPRTTDRQAGQQPQARNLVSLDDLEGAEIRDAQRQDLGSVHRVMLDPQQGEVAYVVVATGGFLGVGRDYVQIPWQNLQVRMDNDDVVVTAERGMLEQAPVAERGWIRDRQPAASPPARQPGQPQYQQQQPAPQQRQ